MQENELLASTISEYKGLLPSKYERDTTRLDAENLIAELSRKHDWTEQGARAVVSLATEYGAFMLRNALALAVALNIEDGALGF